VLLGVDLVSPAIREEAVKSRHFLFVRWFGVVLPCGTIWIHQLRAHVAVSAVDQKSYATGSQRGVEGLFSILQRPLRRNNLPSPNEPLLYFRNARLRPSGIAEQARHEHEGNLSHSGVFTSTFHIVHEKNRHPRECASLSLAVGDVPRLDLTAEPASQHMIAVH
jgi:hypothetical protein